MFKIKHLRTAPIACGRLPRKSGSDAIGSLPLGLYQERRQNSRQPRGSARRSPWPNDRRLTELQPLVASTTTHGTGPPMLPAMHPNARTEFSRWNDVGKDLSFKAACDLSCGWSRSYDHSEGARFRHTAQFNRWRRPRPTLMQLCPA